MSDALIFHHCRDLAHAGFGVVEPVRLTRLVPEPACDGAPCDDDEWHDALAFEAAYAWLAERQGFWPLFLAVGDDDEARRITGYAHGSDPVLFSWRTAPAGCVYSDHASWHIVLNSVRRDGHAARVEGLGARVPAMVLKPSYRPSAWLRLARAHPGWVQAAVPRLDLRSADAVWCRNRAARRELLARGFARERVEVRRVPRN